MSVDSEPEVELRAVNAPCCRRPGRSTRTKWQKFAPCKTVRYTATNTVAKCRTCLIRACTPGHNERCLQGSFSCPIAGQKALRSLLAQSRGLCLRGVFGLHSFAALLASRCRSNAFTGSWQNRVRRALKPALSRERFRSVGVDSKNVAAFRRRNCLRFFPMDGAAWSFALHAEDDARAPRALHSP